MLESIGRYRLIRPLGKGATGTVYLADDPFSQSQVAIKVLDGGSEPGALDETQARHAQHFFQTEAALAGKLRHPHIVSILDAGTEAGSQYLVMEYVEGSNLSDHCSPSTLLPVPRVIEVLYKCCRALDYANQIGVVHRDLKPANILLRPDFEIKVSDFGAALMTRTESTQIVGVGSPAYMSPEQIRGDDLDFRTDMFSLGAVCYHLLAGRLPFPASTPFELFSKIQQSEPEPLARLREDVPPELEAILERALKKRTEERFGSWNEFADRLDDLLTIDAGANQLTDAEKFSAIRTLKFFRRFSDVELWEVVRAAAWKKYAVGATLIREGLHDDHFYIVASGLAKVTARGQLLNAVSPGECVGEMACARRNDQPRSATVTTLEPSWAIGLKMEDLDRFSAPCKARFQEAFLAVMAERISMLTGRLLSTLETQRVGLI